MEYFLCNSSSEEEGEIKVTKLRLDERSIYARSFYDKHYFVGPNKSVLPVRRIFSEKKPEYLKKRLKKIPYFANLFTFLNQFKVPKNEFVLKKELKIQKENFDCQNENFEQKIKSLKLISSTELKKMTNLKEIKHFSKFKNTYLQDMSDALLNSDHKGTTIILTDRILNNLKKFKSSFKIMKFNNRNIVVFLDPFILKEDFKTLFKFYGKECLAQTLDFTEVRKYLCDDTEIIVFSYNSFESEGKNCRVYFNFDEPKNLNVFVEEDGIKLIEDYEEIDDELSILLGIDFFEEGDYFFEDNSFFISEGLPGENDFDFNYESLFQ